MIAVGMTVALGAGVLALRRPSGRGLAGVDGRGLVAPARLGRVLGADGFQDALAVGSQFGGTKEAENAIMASPRAYSGRLAGLPLVKGAPLLPPVGNSVQDWLDFGAVAVGQTSAAATAVLANNPGRIFGIATVGDFVETDSCGGGDDSMSGCMVSVTFRPRHPGFAFGELVVMAGDVWGGTQKSLDVGLYETKLFGFGLELGIPAYIGTLSAGGGISDSIDVPAGESVGHCFAQPTNAEAPTLTGVYVEVSPGPPATVILHHSSARSAGFDIFCTVALAHPTLPAPGTAAIVPVWDADGPAAIIP